MIKKDCIYLQNGKNCSENMAVLNPKTKLCGLCDQYEKYANPILSKTTWLIENVTSSQKCEFKFFLLFENRCMKNKKFFGVKCLWETCPLRIGRR